MDEGLMDELRLESEGDLRGVVRETMRLGLLVLMPEKVKVAGPLGVERPLAEVLMPNIEDERSKDELKRLRALLKRRLQNPTTTEGELAQNQK
jgi:hypothetical protein